MTAPCLPGLFSEPSRQKVRKRVRDTSRAVYAEARETFVGRRGFVLRILAAYWNRFQVSPTSAELASQDDQWTGDSVMTWDAQLLFVRMGLSDLQTAGVVEAAGKRKCRVSGRLSITWRVVQR